MRNRAIYIITATAILVVASGSRPLLGVERKLRLDEVPSAVRSALEEQAKGGKIVDVDVDEVAGKTVYTSEIQKGGDEIDVRVDADGKLLSWVFLPLQVVCGSWRLMAPI